MVAVTESHHFSVSADSSLTPPKQVVTEKPKSQVTQVETSDTWFFGKSQFRIDSAGCIRPAAASEIDGEAKYHPAAMLQVLAAGAETLRWNPVERYDINNPGDGDPYASGPQSPTEILRYRMRQDIANGRFTIDDSGKIYENTPGPWVIDPGPPSSSYRENVARQMAPEEVGFELNALLIESLAEKIDKLSDLGSQLAVLDQWVMEQLAESEKDKVEIYVLETRNEIKEQTTNVGGLFGHSGWKTNEELSQWTIVSDPTPFDKFIQNKFPEVNTNGERNGHSVLDAIRKEYEGLLENTGLELGDWGAISTTPEVKNVGTRTEDWRYTYDPLSLFEIPNGRLYTRKQPQERRSNQLELTATTFKVAMENTRSRESTYINLSEQLGTNVTQDSNRSNNVYEAINGALKSWNNSATALLKT